MASQVTTQRVRDVLSSFLIDNEKKVSSTPSAKSLPSSSNVYMNGPPSSDSSVATSPPQVTNRRSFTSFLQRVNTFSSMTWFAKPLELSPLVCSRYGWENTDYDMLHCTACRADLCGVLPDMHDSKAYGEACHQLQEKLQTAHEKFCQLAVNPCPEAYLKLGLDDIERLSCNFRERLRMLSKVARHLPQLSYTQLESWGFAESHAAKFLSEENFPADTLTQVVTLAFTGWTLSATNPEVLQCSMCCRHVGLWLFQSGEAAILDSSSNEVSLASNSLPAGELPRENGDASSSPPAGETTGEIGETSNSPPQVHMPSESGDAGPPSKKIKLDTKTTMDPVSDHYVWCPWVALRVLTEGAVTYFTPLNNHVQGKLLEDHASPSTLETPAPVEDAQKDMTSKESVGEEQPMPVSPHNKQPAWVLAVRLVAPGLLSHSRRLVQKVKQSSMAEGLQCIRKVIESWMPPPPQLTSPSAQP